MRQEEHSKIGRAHVCTPVTPRSTLFPLHDALPILRRLRGKQQRNFLTTLFLSQGVPMLVAGDETGRTQQDRKSTRLHSSHTEIYTLSPTRRSSDLKKITG